MCLRLQMDVRCHIVVHTWIPHWVMITQAEVPIWFRSLQVILNMSWQTAVCVCKALEIDATRINLQTGEKMSSVNSSCLINYLPFFCAFLINFWYSASHCLNPKFYLFINIIHQSFCQTILNNNSIYVRLRLSSFAKCFDRLAKPNPEFQQKAGN